MTTQASNTPAIPNNSELHYQMILWRHWLHQHPELMFEEFLSSDYIASILESYDIEMHRGLAKTGIVATIHGKQKGDAIGLRADMDALPIPELNEFAHKSKHDGKMHACGHDGHSTMLLGAAIYLKQYNDFSGSVHFIFQPAEEGGGGGKIMVEEGLFDLFPCKAVYGMHNWPGLAAGKFAVHDRAVMAAVDKIEISITGKGGHAAMPDQLVDPILTGAQVIIALQSIVSRNLSPLESAVISLTMLEAGHASNVMPDELKITGTLRYFYPEDGERIKVDSDYFLITAKTNTVWKQELPAEGKNIKVIKQYAVTEESKSEFDSGIRNTPFTDVTKQNKDISVAHESVGIIHATLVPTSSKNNKGIGIYLTAVQFQKFVPYTGDEVELVADVEYEVVSPTTTINEDTSVADTQTPKDEELPNM